MVFLFLFIVGLAYLLLWQGVRKDRPLLMLLAVMLIIAFLYTLLYCRLGAM